VVIPAPCLAAARARQVEPTHRSQPRTLTLANMGAELTLADFRRVGIASHMRRKIRPEDCDELGFYAPPPPRIFWTKESSNQGVMDRVWGSVPGFVWPSMEMRTLDLRPLRAGDVLDSYTALLSVGHKVIHSGVWVFDAANGDLVSTTHQVNIFFRLATRRAQDMPVPERARIEALATPELLAA
jgi:acyl-CoA thioesterase FadM